VTPKAGKSRAFSLLLLDPDLFTCFLPAMPATRTSLLLGLLIFPLFLSPLYGQPSDKGRMDWDKEKRAILKVLEQQTLSWNQAHMEAFMEGYWQSDSLQFIGRNGITTGWQHTLNRYKTAYPNQETMGRLRFDIARVEWLGHDEKGRQSAFVVGKFFLYRPEKGDARGHFTLLWKKINGHWVIVLDHSSGQD
jgi:hypothetical protein